jgi:hypothetical protein
MNSTPQPRSGFGVRAYHSRVDSEQYSGQPGWRLPRNLIVEIREAARGAGVPVGAYVARMLRRGLIEENRPLTASEVEARIRYRY